MRMTADCRSWPSQSGCSLTISGAEEEVVATAAMHAAAVHGHEDNAETRDEIRRTLTEDRGPGRYGTVMIATLTGNLEAMQQASEQWALERHVPGFLVDELLVGDDGRTVVLVVFFASREDYERLAEDPEQDRWYSQHVAPNVSDVRWIDGTWQRAVQRLAPPRIPSPSPAT